MNYQIGHIRRLQRELEARYRNLLYKFPTGTDYARNDEIVSVDGMEMRLAVDDFKAILAEIRRLK